VIGQIIICLFRQIFKGNMMINLIDVYTSSKVFGSYKNVISKRVSEILSLLQPID